MLENKVKQYKDEILQTPSQGGIKKVKKKKENTGLKVRVK